MPRFLSRRTFLAGSAALGMDLALSRPANEAAAQRPQKQLPNIVFIFADQWRAQAMGYAGDVNAHTPCLDKLSRESVRFTQAVSAQPVCSPYRACLLTGQYPMTHGVFMNDVPLNPEATTLAKVCAQAGYDTAYIGKWHLDGHGRSAFTPPERRQGFQYWRALECTHDYNNSRYYGDEPAARHWDGYDAIAQTQDARRYIQGHAGNKPFLLVMSWGPPHDPYHTAPEQYQKMVHAEDLIMRGNVPEANREEARAMLAGYYAHGAALDACVGDLLTTLDEEGVADHTIFVFTSDHGDMLGSHGARNKQQPYAESIRVPLLVRYPEAFGREDREFDALFNAPDIMPTLLGLADIPVPETVQGRNYAEALRTGRSPSVDSALIMCPAPFGQWTRARGGREYRGVYTGNYTYTRSLEGPWLLFDNVADPWQMNNLVGQPHYAGEQERLDALLNGWLEKTQDPFKSAAEHLAEWGYVVDESGTAPYTP